VKDCLPCPRGKIHEDVTHIEPASPPSGAKGSADAERNPRNIAIKFYMEEENYDFVGNNTPVLFIRDPADARDRHPYLYVHVNKHQEQKPY